MIIPIVKKGEEKADIYSTLLQDRIVFLHDAVTTESAQQVVSQLLYLESQDKDKDIYLYINSPGGSVIDGFAIYDTMNLIKPDVVTIVTGMAASMGFFLASSGAKGKRFALPNAELMMHQVSFGGRGHVEDMKISYEHGERLNKKLFKIMADNIGGKMTEKKLIEMANRDVWMEASEAVKIGVIDAVMSNK